MNISEISGEKFTFELCGKTYKAKRLSIGDIYGYFEELIKKESLADAKKVSEILPLSQRGSFLIQAWEKLPKGATLFALANEKLATMDGACAMLYLATKDEDNKDIISPDTFLNVVTLETVSNPASGFNKAIGKVTGMDIFRDVDDDGDGEEGEKAVDEDGQEIKKN